MYIINNQSYYKKIFFINLILFHTSVRVPIKVKYFTNINITEFLLNNIFLIFVVHQMMNLNKRIS